MQRSAQPCRKRALFLPAPSATVRVFARVILLQNEARVCAHPVRLLVLRLKGAGIDDITVVTCKALGGQSV